MMESKRIESFGSEVSAAYKTIAEYKWNKEFVCSNCNSVDYFEGKYPYSRRCLKCKKDYSPTEGTVFHGVRFPLPIAIYIVQRVAGNTNRVTIEELAKYISFKFDKDIREKTIWAFLNKVYSAMEFSKPRFDDNVTIIRLHHGNKTIIGIKGFSDFKKRVMAFVADADGDNVLKDLIKVYKGKNVLIDVYDVKHKNHLEATFKIKSWHIDVTLTSILNKADHSDYSVKTFALDLFKAIAGVNPNHYQAYINFYCFSFNEYTHKELMKVLVNPISRS